MTPTVAAWFAGFYALCVGVLAGVWLALTADRRQ